MVNWIESPKGKFFYELTKHSQLQVMNQHATELNVGDKKWLPEEKIIESVSYEGMALKVGERVTLFGSDIKYTVCRFVTPEEIELVRLYSDRIDKVIVPRVLICKLKHVNLAPFWFVLLSIILAAASFFYGRSGG